MYPFHIFLILSLMLLSCSNEENPSRKDRTLKEQAHGEFIYRKKGEYRFQIPPPQLQQRKSFSWEKGIVGNLPKITKEFFRCKGCNLNPPHVIKENGKIEYYHDCGGVEKHSLPLHNNKEYIYPILVELMNYLQEKTKKRVVITSGHRCPEHNTYVDPSPGNRYSKHMIGAEVSFYVRGMEEFPERIVKLLQEFYLKQTRYHNKKDFTEFKRYEKKDIDVSTQPWMNKEIFIKLYKKKEGRNFDNRHPYPYISIQVRYDSEANEKVIYTWAKAFNNYLRR